MNALTALTSLTSLSAIVSFLKGLKVRRFARFTSYHPDGGIPDVVGALFGNTYTHRTYVHGTRERGYSFASEEVANWAKAKGLSPEVLVELIDLNDHDPDGTGQETQAERYTRVVEALDAIVKGRAA